MKIKNPWKIAAIILGVVVISLMIYQGYNESKINNKMINLGGFSISEETLEDFYNVLEKDKPVKICSIEENKCSIIKFTSSKNG